jgi:uncharacterized protein
MGDAAVIEVLPEDFEKVLTARESIDQDLKKIGFTHVALDLKGYSTGSMTGGKGGQSPCRGNINP